MGNWKIESRSGNRESGLGLARTVDNDVQEGKKGRNTKLGRKRRKTPQIDAARQKKKVSSTLTWKTKIMKIPCDAQERQWKDQQLPQRHALSNIKLPFANSAGSDPLAVRAESNPHHCAGRQPVAFQKKANICWTFTSISSRKKDAVLCTITDWYILQL